MCDQTWLSAHREKLQELKAELAYLPDVRQERIAVLERAIHDGGYHVTDQQIADAMFSELLGQAFLGEVYAYGPAPTRYC